MVDEVVDVEFDVEDRCDEFLDDSAEDDGLRDVEGILMIVDVDGDVVEVTRRPR